MLERDRAYGLHSTFLNRIGDLLLQIESTYPSREDVTRNQILDACIQCIDTVPLSSLKFKHIVEGARLTRRTIYNYFKNRDDIIISAFQREGIAISRACAAEITRYDDPEEKFVQGFVWMHRNLPKNPVLNLLCKQDPVFLDLVGFPDLEVEMYGQLCFGEVFDQNPKLAQRAPEISELWTRNLMSFLTLPGAHKKTEEELELYVRQWLVPGLRMVLSE